MGSIVRCGSSWVIQCERPNTVTHTLTFIAYFFYSPEVKKAINPVVADDGIFYVTKKEFFKFFSSIYLSASNMTQFLED